MHLRRAVLVVVFLLARAVPCASAAAAVSSSPFDVFVPDYSGWEEPAMRPNPWIGLDARLGRLVTRVIHGSATLRRQWQRLLEMPRLSVRLELVPAGAGASSTSEVLAAPGGPVTATIYVSAGRGLAARLRRELAVLAAWTDVHAGAVPCVATCAVGASIPMSSRPRGAAASTGASAPCDAATPSAASRPP